MIRVAITGFGVISPIGIGRSAFFDGLAAARGGVGPVTRFDASTFDVQVAGEVNEALALPENVSRVAKEDVKIGFAWAAVEEALTSAGVKELTHDSIVHLATSLEVFDLSKVITDGGADFRTLATRISSEDNVHLQLPLDTASTLIEQRWGKPAMNLVNCSACAASAQAIGHGFHSIRGGKAKMAVCGGFDSMINPLGLGGFQLLGALTTDNDRGASACRPFDATRSGTVLGEGAAVFVLEDLEVAEEAGKDILAELRGFGSTLDANSLSAPDPEGDGAVRSMQMALDDAQVGPGQIDHINVHGTGTFLNDEIEATAIRRAFPGWDAIPVSATKSVTGHLIGAAGAIELGACLFALNRRQLPVNPWLQSVGHNCELRHVIEPIDFDGDYVLSNSFGFGGQNTTLIMRRHDG